MRSNIGRWARRGALALGGLLGALVGANGCVYEGEEPAGIFQLKVGVTLQNGDPLPGPDGLTCLDLRGINPDCPGGQFFKLSIEALDVSGQRDTTFNRSVRVSILPGTIVSISSPPEGDGVGVAEGRNVRLVDGYADQQTILVTGAFGPTRLLVEDIGYQPGDPTLTGRPPSCADGLDNDDNGLIDFPADPGCAYSNDDTEATPTFAAGVSPPLNFVYPKLTDVQGCPSPEALKQGLCGGTPFAQEGVTVETRPERGSNVMVTRVSSSGMYVVDIDEKVDEAGAVTYVAKPYSSLFVFNFGVPEGVLVCDRVTQLTGTMDEFFGYTEMVFPSFEVEPFDPRPQARTPNKVCRLPEPFVIEPAAASNDAVIEAYEGGLVRVRNGHVAGHFGADPPQQLDNDLNPATDRCGGGVGKKYIFGPGASNCDFDRSGGINFAPGAEEGICSCFCYRDPECSEWSSFRGRGTFRVVLGGTPEATIQANVSALSTFDPVDASRRAAAASTPEAPVRAKLLSLTGTVANFSGGNLNWTIEARCSDDLVLCPDGSLDCADDPLAGISSQLACIGQRTSVDNDSESGN